MQCLINKGFCLHLLINFLSHLRHFTLADTQSYPFDLTVSIIPFVASPMPIMRKLVGRFTKAGWSNKFSLFIFVRF